MNIKEYRETANNKSGGTELFMSEYPLYCQYMLDIHEQYGHLDYHGPNPVGAHFKFYHSQVKKILEHIARHRTYDLKQEMKGKTHLLGRAYRKVLEPLCFITGKIKSALGRG